MTSSRQDEFFIVYWYNNHLYTAFENFKYVNQGDEVICLINYKKDIGSVLFVGSEFECKQELNKYFDKKNQLKRTINGSFSKNINNGPLKYLMDRYRYDIKLIYEIHFNLTLFNRCYFIKKLV
jgi:hypothetical protein